MTKLYKLDLEPDEIYNVSLNIKQGNKTVDNLRFFQTKVPKLFNLKPSNFSTFSQIIEVPDAVVTNVVSSGISKGGPSQPVGVSSVTWTSSQIADSREDGVTAYEPGGLTYKFTITFDDPVSFTSYYLSGFKGQFEFLNYRTDYRISGNTLTLELTLADIDPNATTKYGTSPIGGSGISPNIVDAVKAGYTTMYFSDSVSLAKVVVGRSVVTAFTTGARPTTVWSKALVTGVGKFTDEKGRKLKWLSVGKAALADKAANSTVAIYGLQSSFTFTGNAYGVLGKSGTKNSTKDEIKSANIVWQTFPTYNAKNAKTDYTFKKSSFISSSLINPNVLEKLIWEDEVRDYIYFIISDIDGTTGDRKKYFFGTYGPSQAMTTLATEKTSLEGTFIFNSKLPPSPPDYLTNINNKIFKTSTGKVKYYEATVTKDEASTPALLRKVSVQFAIARYTKGDTGWKGEWLPGRTQSPGEILSGAEVLE